MRLNTFAVLWVITAFGITLTGCGEHGPMSPASPSLMSSRAAQDTQRSGTRLAPRRIDNDGDGYEDPDPGMPTDPATSPMPNPEQIPLPEEIPAPVQLTIIVVGLFGPLSFAPNPQHAAIGNTIVWMNNDVLQHDIVLDDGTPVGNLAPGQSSIPISLTTETASYHCTIHPSMTGQITPLPMDEILPPDPSQTPMPDPSGSPPPDPYGDGYDDAYEDDYY